MVVRSLSTASPDIRRVMTPILRRQSTRGFALLIILALLSVGALYLVVEQLSVHELQRKRDDATANALAEAKAAIIGWAVTNGTLPGRLPCPEDVSKIGTGLEGQALANCSNVNPSIGRLAWRTLGTGQLLDGNSEPLWYVLSPGFRSAPINTNSLANLSVDGTVNAAVALIFAPGPPLAGQSRTAISASSPPLSTDYLDLTNNDGDSAFASTGNATTFNDRLTTISMQELGAALAGRIAGELRGYPGKGLRGYFDLHGFLPCAAAVVGGLPVANNVIGFFPAGDPDISFDAATTNILTNNQWFGIVSYRSPGCGAVGANSATIGFGAKTIALKFP